MSFSAEEGSDVPGPTIAMVLLGVLLERSTVIELRSYFEPGPTGGGILVGYRGDSSFTQSTIRFVLFSNTSKWSAPSMTTNAFRRFGGAFAKA